MSEPTPEYKVDNSNTIIGNFRMLERLSKARNTPGTKADKPTPTMNKSTLAIILSLTALAVAVVALKRRPVRHYVMNVTTAGDQEIA